MKFPRHCYEFGPFRLDPSERQLLRAGQVMPLTPKVFDTLLLFVENNNLLLSVSDEAELEQFLGDLIKKAGRAVGGVIKSPVGQALGGALKGVAKQALPALGSAAGNMLLPGVGGVVGGQLASAAGKMFGLELEGLSYEDQEFEAAKGVVRLAGAAASNAAQAEPSTPPQQVVQSALTESAQRHAPGLLSGAQPQGAARPNGACAHKSNGRWVRRGNAIVLMGA